MRTDKRIFAYIACDGQGIEMRFFDKLDEIDTEKLTNFAFLPFSLDIG